jgi:predicted amino acid-binding ACT domain protein
MIAKDRRALHFEYLELGRYTRFKLIELEAEVVEPAKVEADDREIQEYMRETVRGFRIEPYLLIHNAGIGVVTAWINLKGKFSVDDIITLEKRLDEIKLNVKDAFGNQLESITLGGFVDVAIATPLQAAVLFKDRYGDFRRVFEALGRHEIGMNEIEDGLRDKYTTRHVIVGIREVECDHRCFTAEDVVKKHVKEVAGILTRIEGWRDYRIDTAKEDLGRNLDSLEPSAMYLAIGASLFLGSPKLSKEIEEEVVGSPLDKDNIDTAFRLRMLALVTPMEFLVLSDKILDVYDTFYHKKREKFQERKGRGEVVNPSEYMELRSELTEALEEYRNVGFFKVDPDRSILEYGKEVYRLTEWVDVLRSALDELAELARTHYEERFAKSQLMLTVVFGIFGIFAEIEFLEKLVGLQWALAGAAMTALALVLFYRWFMDRPYRKFWPLRQRVGRAENTDASSATLRVVAEK